MRRVCLVSLAAFLLLLSVGCAPGEPGAFEAGREIAVVSREDGSGTRGVFVELFGLEYKAEGIRKDITTREAIVTNNTGVMLTRIADDRYAIGYLSLGSLSPLVKAVDIAGVAPTAENVKNGTYMATRTFYLATKGEQSSSAQDFLTFIASADGQSVVSESYIAVSDDAPPYRGSNPGGRIVLAGSSSVSPVVEKLREAYLLRNPDAQIEIQMSDSSTGMKAVADGICDIGMSSRVLKESESQVMTAMPIALDGIVVVVNPQNPVNSLTVKQVRDVFSGNITKWGDLRHE